MKLRKLHITKDARVRRKYPGDKRQANRAATEEERQERRSRALDLRIKGYTYEEIAHKMGLTILTIRNYIKDLVEEENRRVFENIQFYRRLESFRLDYMLKGIMDRASQGLPIKDQDGEYVKDKDGNYILKTDLQAIDRVLKIMERRSKFFGLDEPLKNVIKGDPDAPLSLQVVDEESRKVLMKLESMVKNVAYSKSAMEE